LTVEFLIRSTSTLKPLCHYLEARGDPCVLGRDIHRPPSLASSELRKSKASLQRYLQMRHKFFGINRYRAWQMVRQCATKAGLPALVNPETGKARGVSPHRLRDAFAVHAVKVDDPGDGLRLLRSTFLSPATQW